MVNKFSEHLTLTIKARNDLEWWCGLDKKVRMQSPLQSRTLTVMIESDASSTGWGARQGELQTGGR